MKRILDKVSYHAVYEDSIMAALRCAVDSGFAGVQVAVDVPRFSPEYVGETERDAIARFCEANRMRISLHAPDHSISLFVGSRPLIQGIFQYLVGLFEFGQRIGASLMTFHVGVMPTFGTAPRPGRALPEAAVACFRLTLQANLRRLIDTAAGRFVLCIENHDLTPMVCELLQPHLDANELSLCWDLAKMRDDPAVQQYLWQNLAHVRQVHLHDVHDGYSHQVIGSGSVDFAHYLPRLAEAEVLDYCIEVRPHDKAVESLKRLRGLCAG